VYAHDRATGATTLESKDLGALGSTDLAVSADAQLIAYTSSNRLGPTTSGGG
jgi:hypothetical protein